LAAWRVAPVVRTSSSNSTRLPAKYRAVKAFASSASRAARPWPASLVVARTRVSTLAWGKPKLLAQLRAKSSAWS